MARALPAKPIDMAIATASMRIKPVLFPGICIMNSTPPSKKKHIVIIIQAPVARKKQTKTGPLSGPLKTLQKKRRSPKKGCRNNNGSAKGSAGKAQKGPNCLWRPLISVKKGYYPF
jgi:hypothetical protein